MRSKPQSPLSRVRYVTCPPKTSPHSFLVLKKANLASFSHGETIRAPPYDHAHATSSPLDFNYPSADTVKCRHRDGSRARSPIKGLFPAQTKVSDGEESELRDVKPSSGCLIRGRIRFAVSSMSSNPFENRATVSSSSAYISYGPDPLLMSPPGLAPTPQPDTTALVNDETPLDDEIEVNAFNDVLATPTPSSQFQLRPLVKDAATWEGGNHNKGHNEEDTFR